MVYVLNSHFMSDQRVLIVDDEEPARQGLSELVEPEVPSRVELPATTVTKDNVASVQNLGY